MKKGLDRIRRPVFKVGRCLTFQDQYFPKLTKRLEEGRGQSQDAFTSVCKTIPDDECESIVVARS